MQHVIWVARVLDSIDHGFEMATSLSKHLQGHGKAKYMLASNLREGKRAIVNAERVGQSGLQIMGLGIKRGAAMKLYRQMKYATKQSTSSDGTGSWSV